MKQLFTPLLLAGAAMLFTACKKDTSEIVQEEITLETLNQISKLGFSKENVQKIDEGYLVEGDIVLTPQDLQSQSSPQALIVANEEQYRTTNLVKSLPRVITVSVTGSVGSTFSSAVDAAIARYNAEKLQLTFQRVSSGGKINIRIVNTGQYIASAGFPTNSGDPYGEIKYASRYASGYSLGFMTTVLAHEMGHCIGFRHTDYMNRSYSCGGTGGNEGASTVGAIHIPGTPTSPDARSWMLACLGASTDRPFNNNDKTALNYLY